MNLHIVGLDLSLTGTGVAIIRPHEADPIRTRVISTGSVRVKSPTYYPETLARLRTIAGRIVREIRAGMDDGDLVVVLIEGPSYGSSHGQEHARGGLWWLTMHLVEKFAIVVVVPPTTMKRYMTGKGGGPEATKEAVIAAVARSFPDLGIIDNNEADALGLALMGARELGSPMEPSVQRVTPAALEAVNWPEIITQRRLAAQ